MSIAFRDLPVYDLTGATRNFEQLTAFKYGGALEGTLDEPTLTKATKEKFLQLLTVANHKMAFGATEIEWSAKAFESAKLTISTGLATANFFWAFLYPGSGFAYVSGVGILAGGKVEVQARAAGELAAGTKLSLQWFGIE